jgi:uncharacterized membrane protein YecN with MAPEG domain
MGIFALVGSTSGDSPKTGDDTHVALYAALLATASCALAYLAFSKRAKRRASLAEGPLNEPSAAEAAEEVE